MFKRLRKLRDRLYETFMMWMTRHDPKRGVLSRNEPLEMPWEPASAHHCPYCIWLYLIWDVFNEQWHCSHCGQFIHPKLAVTEKRAVVRPPAPASSVEKTTVIKPIFVTGQFSFLHSRHMLANSTELLPNGLPRLAWKNGIRIDTGQLKPLSAHEHKLLMDIFQEDRRTG